MAKAKGDAAVAQRAVELIEFVLTERKAELAHAVVAIGAREGDLDELAYALDQASTDRRVAIDAYIHGKSPRETVVATHSAAAEYRKELTRGLH